MSTKLPLLAELNHAADSLGLYRAELARILGRNCAEVSDVKTLQTLLRDDGDVRRQSENFVCFYRLLEQSLAHDSVAMVHWFRKQHAALGTTPFLAVVDEARLDEVIAQLQSPAQPRRNR
jgi:hypothetical protein